MRALTFLRFLREIRKDEPADLDWIQKQGLLAVKLTQIFALRPDMLSVKKCRQLQKMYRNASTIPSEDVHRIIDNKAPKSFRGSISWFDEIPLVAAVLVGTIIGFIFDTWFGTKPWLILTFFFVGVIAGVLNVIRSAKNMQK